MPPWRAPSSAAWRACARPAPRSSRSALPADDAPAVQQRPDQRRRSLGLASPAAGRTPGRLRPARAGAHPRRQRHHRRADYIDRLQARRRWIAQVEASARGIDAFICPTVPIVAPPLQPLIDDDEAFFATNALLLRNPSVVNYLDGCALSLPCQAAGRTAGRPDGLGRRDARRHRARRVAGHRARTRRRRDAERVRIAVIGAGIVGVTTAYELAADGHEVTVLRAPRRRRRRDQLRQCRRRRARLRHALGRARHAAEGAAPPVRPRMRRCASAAPTRWRQLPWMWRWWRACRPAVYQANRSRMYRLARYSSQRLHALTHDAGPGVRTGARRAGAAAQRARPGPGRRPRCACCANCRSASNCSTPPSAASSSPA